MCKIRNLSWEILYKFSLQNAWFPAWRYHIVSQEPYMNSYYKKEQTKPKALEKKVVSNVFMFLSQIRKK